MIGNLIDLPPECEADVPQQGKGFFMTIHRKTTGLVSAAVLALGALVAISGQEARAASVTASGVTGGCSSGIVDSNPDADGNFNVGVIDVLKGASWDATFDNDDANGTCFFELQNTSSSAFAATITVLAVDQGLTVDDGTLTASYGFEGGVGLFSPELSSRDDGLIVGFPEGVGASFPIGFNIARNSAITFDWIWGEPFGFDSGTPRIAFSVTATPVPLPAAGLMLLGGLGGLGGLTALRRRRKAA